MKAHPAVILLAVHMLVGAIYASAASGDESAAVKSDMEKYENQLNVVLRTRLDEEKAYVHDVIGLIRTGKLPRKLVDKSMQWVRNNCTNDNHAFAYFERVLRIQAERLRFEVPAFSYDVYDASNR